MTDQPLLVLLTSGNVPHKPLQRIFFGPPGTGKSHHVRQTWLADTVPRNIFTMCFHPDMGSGDFIGRLLPHSAESGQVRYSFYPGEFLRAIARAYKTLLLDEQPESVALVIDEINRGNAPAIFGKIFQLLDREGSGWSSYHVGLTGMETEALAREIGLKIKSTGGSVEGYVLTGARDDRLQMVNDMLMSQRLRLPPNLTLIGTMNTADESIFYLDSAFKRRWTWEYVQNLAEPGDNPQFAATFALGEVAYSWVAFVDALNTWLRENGDRIRKVEDKLLGYWFCKHDNGVIDGPDVADKVCFHLWDSVFPRGRDVLEAKLGLEKGGLLTFGDLRQKFTALVDALDVDKTISAAAQ